jgi:chromosome segregation ATPase
MLFGFVEESAASGLSKGEVSALVVLTNAVTLLIPLLLTWLKQWRAEGADVAAKRQRTKKDITKLDLSSTDWILEKYQSMYNELYERVAKLEKDNLNCEKLNSQLQTSVNHLMESRDQQQAEIQELKQENRDLRRRVGDPSGEHSI